jgi:hypothetical protein
MLAVAICPDPDKKLVGYSSGQQFVIFNVLKEYCISKEDKDPDK